MDPNIKIINDWIAEKKDKSLIKYKECLTPFYISNADYSFVKSVNILSISLLLSYTNHFLL